MFATSRAKLPSLSAAPPEGSTLTIASLGTGGPSPGEPNEQSPLPPVLGEEWIQVLALLMGDEMPVSPGIQEELHRESGSGMW